MKVRVAILITGLGLALAGLPVFAEEMGSMTGAPQGSMGEMKDGMAAEPMPMPEMATAPAEESNPAEVPAEAPAQIVMMDNKICPLSGQKTDTDEAVQVEYKGKMYKLCCPMCVKDFNKDPEKYVKAIEDEMAKEAANPPEMANPAEAVPAEAASPTAAPMDMGGHMNMPEEAAPAVEKK